MMGACGMHGEIMHSKYCLRNFNGRIHLDTLFLVLLVL